MKDITVTAPAVLCKEPGNRKYSYEVLMFPLCFPHENLFGNTGRWIANFCVLPGLDIL